MAFARVYVKKQVRLDLLNFEQASMLKMGTIGLASVKNRVQSARDGFDGPSKKLNTGYAIRKQQFTGHRAVRDLTYTGNMLRNMQVRRVSTNVAVAENTTRLDRIKASVNHYNREPWVVFSPTNVEQTVAGFFALLFGTKARQLVLETSGQLPAASAFTQVGQWANVARSLMP